MILLILPLAASAACGEPLVFPDWEIAPPEGTRVIEYAGVPLAERTEVIELELDLVIGSDEPDYAFYNQFYFDVDDDGDVWVLDVDNFRIAGFDAEGAFIRSFGGQGQGPGEWMRPRGFAVVGDRMYVEDVNALRFSAYDHDGNLVAEHVMEREHYFLQGSGLPNGNILAMKQTQLGPRGMFGFTTLIAISPEGGEALTYAVAPLADVRDVLGRGLDRLVSMARPSYDVDRAGGVYFAPGQEYEVHKFDQGGEALWSLRATRDPVPYRQDAVDAAWENARERRPDTARTDYHVPESQPAIGAVAVDGHGHLWVFHFDFAPSYLEIPPSDAVAVDVYDTDGTRLFTGSVPGENPYGWGRAWGDYVYRRGEHPETAESAILRYRLVEPF